MRYRFVALAFFAALLVLSRLDAAPIPPEPYAILDIGPPPKGVSVEEHRKREIHRLTIAPGTPVDTRKDPEVQKLKSVQKVKVEDHRAWLAKNLRVTKDAEESHLRLKFAAGYRSEQVIILNATMRAYVRAKGDRLRFLEECIAKTKDPIALDHLQTELSRYKKIHAVRWAK